MKKMWLTAFIVLGVVAADIFLIDHSNLSDTFLAEYQRSDAHVREMLVEKFAPSLSYAQMLEALEKEDPMCHTEAHAIGKIVFRHSQNLSESLSICKKSCSFGCFHGMLMEAFSTESDTLGGTIDVEKGSEVLGDISAVAKSFCSQAEVREFVFPLQCVHALGHVVMFTSHYDLQKAVTACKKFDGRERDVCAEGAFMEFASSNTSDVKLSEETYYPCDAFPELGRSCYRSKAKFIIKKMGQAGAIEACRELGGEESLMCIRGLGFELSTREKLSTNEGFKSVCDFEDPGELSWCVDGALSRLLLTSSGEHRDCNAVISHLRDKCNSMVDSFE